MNGDFVRLQRSAYDWRDYLVKHFEDGSNEDWSISNGRTLELLFRGAWTLVRYETMRPSRDARVWLDFDHPDGGEGVELDRASMLLRWPG